MILVSCVFTAFRQFSTSVGFSFFVLFCFGFFSFLPLFLLTLLILANMANRLKLTLWSQVTKCICMIKAF